MGISLQTQKHVGILESSDPSRSLLLGHPDTKGIPDLENRSSLAEQLKAFTMPSPDAEIIELGLDGELRPAKGYVRYTEEGDMYCITQSTVAFGLVVKYMQENNISSIDDALNELNLPPDIRANISNIFDCSEERYLNELKKADLVLGHGLLRGVGEGKYKNELERKHPVGIIEGKQADLKEEKAHVDSVKREGIGHAIPQPGTIKGRDVEIHAHNQPLQGKAELIAATMKVLIGTDPQYGRLRSIEKSHIDPRIFSYVDQTGKKRVLDRRGVENASQALMVIPPTLRHLVNDVQFLESLNGPELQGRYTLGSGTIKVSGATLSKPDILKSFMAHEASHMFSNMLNEIEPDVAKTNINVWKDLLPWGIGVNSYVRDSASNPSLVRTSNENILKDPLFELEASSMSAYYCIRLGMDPIEAFRMAHFDIERMGKNELRNLLYHCDRVHRSYVANLGNLSSNDVFSNTSGGPVIKQKPKGAMDSLFSLN